MKFLAIILLLSVASTTFAASKWQDIAKTARRADNTIYVVGIGDPGALAADSNLECDYRIVIKEGKAVRDVFAVTQSSRVEMISSTFREEGDQYLSTVIKFHIDTTAKVVDRFESSSHFIDKAGRITSDTYPSKYDWSFTLQQRCGN